jgi:hypothetical protein
MISSSTLTLFLTSVAGAAITTFSMIMTLGSIMKDIEDNQVVVIHQTKEHSDKEQ